MKSLLIGETAEERVEDQIRGAIRADEDVVTLIHLRTQHIGPDELLVGAKVSFSPTLTMEALTTAIDRIEGAVRTAVPAARILYIEPDVVHAGGAE
jgi:divalent metal cation (Fe/Co/Zn/Cd) transporter